MNEIMRRRRGLMSRKGGDVPTPIPGEYQEVTWIASDGSGYIGTNLRLPKTALQIAGTVEATLDSRLRYFFADRDSGGVRLGISVSDNKFTFFSGISADTEVLSVGTHNIEFTADITQPVQSGTSTTEGEMSLTGKIDNLPFSDSVTGSIRAFGNNNIVLFNNAASLADNYKFYGKMISRLNVISSGSKYYEFVPCYRISDSVIGVYEAVTGAFFPCGGTFTKGADV